MADVQVGFDVSEKTAREARTLLPRGQYLCELYDVIVGAYQPSGKPYIEVKFLVHKSQDGNFIGAKFSTRFNVPTGPEPGEDEDKKARRKTSEDIFGAYWKAVEPDAKGTTLRTERWVGKTVVVDVVQENYTPKDAQGNPKRFDAFGNPQEATVNKAANLYPKSEWRITTPIHQTAPAAGPTTRNPAAAAGAAPGTAPDALPPGEDENIEI